MPTSRSNRIARCPVSPGLVGHVDGAVFDLNMAIGEVLSAYREEDATGKLASWRWHVADQLSDIFDRVKVVKGGVDDADIPV